MSDSTNLITSNIVSFREYVSTVIYANFPSPNAELILGLVFGAEDVKGLGRFNEIMRGVGLIHIVVVSGYNINLVFDLVLKAVGSRFKLLNLIAAQVAVLGYVIMVGFQVPAARALVMSSSLYWTRFLGYKVSPYYLLFFSAIVILLYDKSSLESLSFQLSFAATLGLIVLASRIQEVIEKFPLPKSMTGDVSATISAQIFVLPLIYKAFGTLNLVGFLSNPVILWLVPLMTISALAFILAVILSSSLALVARVPLLILSTIFIKTSEFLFGIFGV